jgi:hypothetical protein
VKRRTLPVATAFAAAATLLLTACGGGGDPSGESDAIADSRSGQGAKKPTKPTEPSGAPEEDKPDGVDVSLPEDMNLVFDWEKPKDGNKAAAMEGAGNHLRAIYRGVDKRTTKDAALTAYATGQGLHYGEIQINERIGGGWTGTGTRRHYDATTRSASAGTSVEVPFRWLPQARTCGRRPRCSPKRRPSSADEQVMAHATQRGHHRPDTRRPTPHTSGMSSSRFTHALVRQAPLAGHADLANRMPHRYRRCP